jgi:hypothetical protein
MIVGAVADDIALGAEYGVLERNCIQRLFLDIDFDHSVFHSIHPTGP